METHFGPWNQLMPQYYFYCVCVCVFLPVNCTVYSVQRKLKVIIYFTIAIICFTIGISRASTEITEKQEMWNRM